MARLTRHAHWLLAATLTGALTFTALLTLRPPRWELYAGLVLAATFTLALYFVQARKNVAAAQLILENQILQLEPVVTDTQSKSVKVHLSSFGILLGSRIIKFNQDRIRLTAVEIGEDYMTLTYGTSRQSQSIKILHTLRNGDALAEVARKFRYETGIVPKMDCGIDKGSESTMK